MDSAFTPDVTTPHVDIPVNHPSINPPEELDDSIDGLQHDIDLPEDELIPIDELMDLAGSAHDVEPNMQRDPQAHADWLRRSNLDGATGDAREARRINRGNHNVFFTSGPSVIKTILKIRVFIASDGGIKVPRSYVEALKSIKRGMACCHRIGNCFSFEEWNLETG